MDFPNSPSLNDTYTLGDRTWIWNGVAWKLLRPGNSSITASALLESIKSVDGVGSGLDADLLDGQSGSYYLDLTNATGTLNATAVGLLGPNNLQTGTYNIIANGNVGVWESFTQEQYSFAFRAQRNITGGGTVSVSTNGEVNWSQRFIIISNGTGNTTSIPASGYFDITVPAAGNTIPIVNGGSVTVTSTGIPLSGWRALYYILPLGSGNSSLPANFRIVDYAAGAYNVPANWILICLNQAEQNVWQFPNNIRLRLGQSTGTYSTFAAGNGSKLYTITTTNQNANNTTYEIARISRDTANWSQNHLDITVYNNYYRGGKTRWSVSYNQVDGGSIYCTEAVGTSLHKVYLGPEVTATGNIKYVPVLVDLPQYTETSIELNYYYNEVSSITASGQIQFTGTYTTNASASAFYGGNVHLVPNTGGSVGIANSTPAARLHVTGDVLFNNTTANTAYFASNGNVGIGTITPAFKIDANTAAARLAFNTYSLDISPVPASPAGGWARGFRAISNSGSTTGADGGVFGAYGLGTTPTYAYMAIPTADQLGFDSTKIIVLDNSGNTGINTRTPLAKLHANGDVLINNTTANVAYFASNGNVGISTTTPLAKLDVLNTNSTLTTTRETTARIYRNDGTYNPRLEIRHSTTGTDLNHTYSTTASAFTFSVGGTETIRIDGGANTGIGNSTPAAKLHVSGTVLFNNSSANVMFVAANGNVGLGTTTPAQKLDVSGYAQATQFYVVDSNAIIARSGTDMLIRTYAGYNMQYLASGNAIFGSNTVERIRIDKGGNTGIGNSTPAAVLHITGDMLVGNSTANSAYFASNGNVGIGTITPTQPLHIIGTSTNADNNQHLLAEGATQGILGLKVTGGNLWTIRGNATALQTRLAGSGDLFTLLQSGNIGISNTAPADRLSVNGTTYLGGNSTIVGFANVSAGVNSSSYNVGTTVVANTTGVYATQLSGQLVTDLVSNSALVGYNYINATTAATTYVSNSALQGYNLVNTSGSFTLAGNTTLAGSNTLITSNAIFSATVTINGDLTVQGTTTYVNAVTVNIGDNIITLNADVPAATAPTQDSGIEVNRGSSANVQFIWDETNDRWSTNGQPFATGNTTITGDLSVTGNTTLGDAASDKITINANSIVIAANASIDAGTLYIDSLNDRVGIGNTTPAHRLSVGGISYLGGNSTLVGTVTIANSVVSVPTWGANGVSIIQNPGLWTDTTSTGTVADVRVNYFAPQTVAGSNPFTASFLYGTYFANPVAGTNVTASNVRALGADSLTVAGTISLNGAISASPSSVTSTYLIGGSSQTGTITVGRSTATQTVELGSAATTAGNTKTINIGTGGVAGSQTNITIGASAANSSITLYANSTTFSGSVSGITTLGVGNTTITGDLSVTGNSTFGDAATDRITFNANSITIAANASIDVGTLYIDSLNDRVGIGNSTPSNKLFVTGDIGLDGVSVRDTANSTTTSTTQFTLFEYPVATYDSADVVIKAVSGGERHFTKLLVTANSTVAIATEYGTLQTGSLLFTADVDVTSGNTRIRITPTSATSTTFKTSYELITA